MCLGRPNDVFGRPKRSVLAVRSRHIHNTLIISLLTTAVQKAAFCNTKDGLSASNLPCFGTRKTAFYKQRHVCTHKNGDWRQSLKTRHPSQKQKNIDDINNKKADKANSPVCS